MAVGLLGVPTSAGAHAVGQEKAPQHLRRMGLVERLEAGGTEVIDFGDLPLALYRPGSADRRAQNLDRVVGVARRVADGVDAILRRGLVPLVLGGDCTITLGVLAGFGRHPGDLGLLYLDGDVDMTTPDTTSSGILDSMGLAHALGMGAPELAGLGPRRPLVDPDRVVAYGHSPAELEPVEREMLERHGVACHPAGEGDPAQALRDLEGRADRILVHFDLDVVDSAEFPLADFPHHNLGLSFADAAAALGTFCAGPAFAGLVVTEVNPDHDPDGSLTGKLIGALADAL